MYYERITEALAQDRFKGDYDEVKDRLKKYHNKVIPYKM